MWLNYALIGLSLALVGVAGLQFMYLFYLGRVDDQRKRHIHDLELQCKRLAARLTEAEDRIAEQDELLAKFIQQSDSDEVWADIIEEK